MTILKNLLSCSLFLIGLFFVSQLEAQITFTTKTTADGLGHNTVGAIFVDGSNVYLGTGGGVAISTDGGATFVNRTTANGLPNNIVVGIFGNGTEVYAGTFGGFAISTDNGATFTSQTATDGLGSVVINDIYVVGGTCGKTIYAATNGNGVGFSTDGGQTFATRTMADGLGSNHTQTIVVIGDTWYVGTNEGMSISTDGGVTFVNVVTAPASFHRLIRSVFIDGSTIYAGTNFGGMSVSTDGGVTYTNKTTADGLGSNAIYGIYKNGNNMYIAAHQGSAGFSTSTDGGNSFDSHATPHRKTRDLFISGTTIYLATDAGLAMYDDLTLPLTASSRPTVPPTTAPTTASASLLFDTDNATQLTTSLGMQVYSVDVCGDLEGFSHNMTSSGGIVSLKFLPSSNTGCQTAQVIYGSNVDWTLEVTIEDGCNVITKTLSSSDIVLAGASLLTIDAINVIKDESCIGKKDGELSVQVSGGDLSCGNYTFSWTGPSGFTANTQTITGLGKGSYQVTVTDCVGTMVVGAQLVRVVKGGGRGGRGGGACKTAVETLLSDFRLQPNPAHDYVQVYFEATTENDEQFQISLVDLAGRVLQQIETDADGIMNFDLNDVTNGLYIVQIQSNNQILEQAKLVVVK